MSNLSSTQQDLGPIRQRLLAELRASHHAAYFQLISIIQACVFAYLIGSVVTNWKLYAVPHWILVVTTGLFVVIVWNGYVRGITPVVYSPKLLDGLIPFLLGLAQCILVFGTKDPNLWFWGLSAVSGVGFLGYLNQKINSCRDSANDNVMPYILGHLRIQMGSSLTIAVLSAALAWFVDESPYLLATLALLIGSAYVIQEEILWLRLIGFAHAERDSA